MCRNILSLSTPHVTISTQSKDLPSLVLMHSRLKLHENSIVLQQHRCIQVLVFKVRFREVKVGLSFRDTVKNLEILCLALECKYTWKVNKTILLCISSVSLYLNRGTPTWMPFRNFLFWNVCEPIKSLMPCRSEKLMISRRS